MLDSCLMKDSEMLTHLDGGWLRSDKPVKSEAGTSVWGKVTLTGNVGVRTILIGTNPGNGPVVDLVTEPPTSGSHVMWVGKIQSFVSLAYTCSFV